MRIGIHTSIAASLEKAALKAAELGANAFQIFSASPRMWKANLPDPAQIRLLHKAREKHDLYPLVIHDSYLINLGSCDEDLRCKSTQAFRGEIVRALLIGAEYLVAHPGNCKGYTREQGIVAVVRSLVEAAADLDTSRLTVLLENTAGAGAALGSRFEDLKMIRDHAGHFTDLRIGYCIDTCHAFVSGYEVPQLAAEIERALSHEHVPVMHANDSKGGFESHLDRHANIGEGCIGHAGFRMLLRDPKLRDKTFILETPVDNEGDDAKNVAALKRAAALRPRREPRVL